MLSPPSWYFFRPRHAAAGSSEYSLQPFPVSWVFFQELLHNLSLYSYYLIPVRQLEFVNAKLSLMAQLLLAFNTLTACRAYGYSRFLIIGRRKAYGNGGCGVAIF
jgi:hypothetical protein